MTINPHKTRRYRRGTRTEITPHSVQTQSKHIDNNVIKPYTRTEKEKEAGTARIRPCTDKKEEYEEREKRIKKECRIEGKATLRTEIKRQ